VKEALKLISENPDKYKNVKFVTGSEISFVIKSDKTTNPYETSELLVYGFNPFNKNIEGFFSGIKEKRKHKANDFINDLNQMFGYAEYSIEEFEEIYKTGNPMMNNQWKVHHYGQTKNAIAGFANSQNKDKTSMYKAIMTQIPQNKMTLDNLRRIGAVPQSYGDDTRITKLCKEKYSPHNTFLGIDYAGENNFDSIIDTFANGDNFIALAHPYYITERCSNANELITTFVKKSKGFLRGSESYHQAYKNVDINSVQMFNAEIVKANKFTELGGRDNHEKKWLTFFN